MWHVRIQPLQKASTGVMLCGFNTARVVLLVPLLAAVLEGKGGCSQRAFHESLVLVLLLLPQGWPGRAVHACVRYVAVRQSSACCMRKLEDGGCE